MVSKTTQDRGQKTAVVLHKIRIKIELVKKLCIFAMYV
jgi:hypothetical protein